MPPQIYFSTFSAFVEPVGIAADNAGNAYVLSLDGGVSRVTPQGGISSVGGVAGYPTQIAVNPADGAAYVAWQADSGDNYVSEIGGNAALLPGANYAFVSGVAVDSNTGHVYAVETYFNASGDGVLQTLEYGADLSGPLNSATVDDGASADIEAFGQSAAVDSSGNVYALASRCDIPIPPEINQQCDLLAVKYAPHLAQRFYRSMIDISPFPRASFSYGEDVAADAAGNAYLVGSAELGFLNGSGYRGGVLVKLDPSGATAFMNNTNSLGGDPAGGLSAEMPSVAADSASNIYVVANIQAPGTSGYEGQAVKYASDGSLAWDYGLLGSQDQDVGEVSVDAKNNVYMVWPAFQAGVDSTYVAKFGNATGQNSLFISTGDLQVGVVGSAVAVPLTVLVQNGSSAPAAGVAVTFSTSSAPAGAVGQGVLPANATTAPTGLASTVLTLGNIPADYYVRCACPSCAPSLSSATFHACGKLNAPNFSQGDTQWGGDIYGLTVSSRVRALGCALSSLADINNFYTPVNASIPATNPGLLNAYLIHLGTAGYQAGTAMNWPAIQRFTGNHIRYVQAGSGDINGVNTQAALLATADADLLRGRPLIFHVRHPTSHFVAVVGKCGNNYLISDPGDHAHTQFNPNDPSFAFVGIRRFSAR